MSQPRAAPTIAPGPPPASDAAQQADLVLRVLSELQRATETLIAPIAPEDWQRSHHPVMGPVAWDVGHMAQQEDHWIAQVLGGREETEAGLNRRYDAYENPRVERAALPLPSRRQVARLRARVRARTLQVLRGAPRDDDDPRWRGLFLPKMVALHEAQHQETILQHAAAFPPGRYAVAARAIAPTPGLRRDDVFVWHPGGAVGLGVDRYTPWTYDNEWPAWESDVAGFWLQATPATNGQFQRFIAAGGYEDDRWWHPEGWRHKEAEGWRAPLHWEERDGARLRRSFDEVRPVDPAEPVMHVSWFEADACARFLGCRLPTEAEWETAATFDPAPGTTRSWPWGDARPDTARANLDQARWGPDPVGSHPAGSSALNVEQLIGDVWEWTRSEFRPYPGFEAFPYRDYSERFFGPEHRVLRGGSWATRSLLRLGTFRNWDLPQRRQVFAGFRLAADKPPAWASAEGAP